MTKTFKNLEGVKQILGLAVRMQKQEQDSIFLFGGQEGSGKSSLILHCVQIVDELKKTETPINYITRNLREMISLLYKLEKGSQSALDEGGELSSDSHFDPIVRATRAAFTVMRGKKLIIYLAFTNPAKVATYFREDRVKGVFFIPKKGQVWFYTRTQLQTMLEKQKKYHGGNKSIKSFVKLMPPLFKDTFPKYEGRLWKAYQQRKDENIDDVLEDLYMQFGQEDKAISYNQAAKHLGIRKEELRKYISEGEEDQDPMHTLPVSWNLRKTKMFIKISDLELFKTWYDDNILKKAAGTAGTDKDTHSVYSTGKKLEEKEQQ